MNLSKFQFGYEKHGIIDCIKNVGNVCSSSMSDNRDCYR